MAVPPDIVARLPRVERDSDCVGLTGRAAACGMSDRPEHRHRFSDLVVVAGSSAPLPVDVERIEALLWKRVSSTQLDSAYLRAVQETVLGVRAVPPEWVGRPGTPPQPPPIGPFRGPLSWVRDGTLYVRDPFKSRPVVAVRREDITEDVVAYEIKRIFTAMDVPLMWTPAISVWGSWHSPGAVKKELLRDLPRYVYRAVRRAVYQKIVRSLSNYGFSRPVKKEDGSGRPVEVMVLPRVPRDDGNDRILSLLEVWLRPAR